jgi:hypothetical protein
MHSIVVAQDLCANAGAAAGINVYVEARWSFTGLNNNNVGGVRRGRIVQESKDIWCRKLLLKAIGGKGEQ